MSRPLGHETATVTDRRFRSRFTVPAIGFGVVAVIGLVLVVLAGFLRAGALGLVVPGFALGLAALPAAGLGAVALVQETGARGIARRISIPIVLVLCGCALAIGPAGLAIGWALTPNPAAEQAAPLLRDLRAEGAEQICESGDAGRGPDNFTAWQTGFYRIPAAAADPEALRRLAQQRGHVLVQRSAEETVDPRGIRLTTERSESDDRYLTVLISRGPVDLQCTVDGVYGRSYTPPAGQRLLVVSSGAPASG